MLHLGSADAGEVGSVLGLQLPVNADLAPDHFALSKDIWWMLPTVNLLKGHFHCSRLSCEMHIAFIAMALTRALLVRRSCRARLQLHNNRRRKRDEAPAPRPAETSASKEGEAAGAEESSPTDSTDADPAIVSKGQRSSRKRRSPRSSSDGSKQVKCTG